MWNTRISVYATFANDDDDEGSVHIERIHKNNRFWAECILKAEHFFKTCYYLAVMNSLL